MKKLAGILGVLLLSYMYVSAGTCSSIVTSDLMLDSETREVLTLQNFLKKKSLLTVTPNGYFGQNTKRAVMAYQDSIGLPDTGTVFAATRQAINDESCSGTVPVEPHADQPVIVKNVETVSCVDIPDNLFRGDENKYVHKLQDYLVKKGLLSSTPNSYYGVGTTAAVKAYQQQNGFKVTGDTFAMMREEIKNETCIISAEVSDPQDTLLLQGCSSRKGFSTLTGISCSMVFSFPAGCTSAKGFSVTTGIPCSAVSSSQFTQAVTMSVTQMTPSASTTSEVYKSPSLQLTPNSPGLPFLHNSTHIKLATVTIHSPYTSPISSLTLTVASSSSSLAANTISNFTLTDVVQDKIINGGPIFNFTNQTVIANQTKVYEIYSDIGQATSSQIGSVTLTGVVALGAASSTITNIMIPAFTILVSDK